MASQKPPDPTTITSLSDDLLREIFLRLPALPSLARAAFTCRAFLRAVRSSGPFRRRFHALHPPLLAFFLEHIMTVIPAFPTDPGSKLVAGFRGANFFGVRGLRLLSRDEDPEPGWQINSWRPCQLGQILLQDVSPDQGLQGACYSPLTHALQLYPPEWRTDTVMELHTLIPSSTGEVVCVRHDEQWTRAHVAVFSAEWRLLPETSTPLPAGHGGARGMGTVLNGSICWKDFGQDSLLVLSTTTFHFSLVDVPPPCKGQDNAVMVGKTKDGQLCVAYTKVDMEDKKTPSLPRYR